MFRNKEIRQFTLLFGSIAIASSLLGFFIDFKAGCLILASDVVFAILFLAFTKARYRKIAQLSEQIDKVLHNAQHLSLSDESEGELAILQDEITKMTLRIREQNDTLKKEKANLADSLADIAHQLRTPLTSVNLILSLLENTPDEKERRNLIREAMELFDQMDWLLNSLLKLSRLDAGIVVFQNEPIGIASWLPTSLRPLLIPLELKEIILHTDIPQAAVIYGDSGWLSEVIRNVVKNCAENTPQGGTIEILCEDNTLYTEITIHDSGNGFESEDLPFLFERFYRGKDSDATGYGIGLALCRMIVLRQNGTITAKNHPKGGALFTIRFPK